MSTETTRLITYKLIALLYDIIPPTTAIVDYVMVLNYVIVREELSANGQLFDGAQTAASL